MTSQPPVPERPTQDEPWSVSTLAEKLKNWIDRLGAAWIEGEIVQWNISGGNVYGKLKDITQDVTVSFTIWSSVFAQMPKDFKQGDRVMACVKVNYWLKGGTLSMQVSSMKHVGLGDLLERLEQLRSTLRDEGLFDAHHKKPLPFLPKTIGLITGRDSDAEKDVLRNAHLNWSSVHFKTEYSAVQGERTVQEVCQALSILDADPEVEVIIIARGGGDFQHLLPFSDEKLVRAAFTTTTPIVSAIGHEADRPLLDDVADLRASTPTDAAKRVVPNVTEQRLLIEQLCTRAFAACSNLISAEVSILESIRSRPALKRPHEIFEMHEQDIVRHIARASELITHQLELETARIFDLSGKVNTLSPLATLKRGYAIVKDDKGQVALSSQQTPTQSTVHIRLAQDVIEAKVSSVSSAPSQTLG